ncbi:hypothetical protein QE373_001699 [Stenotrophomonas sp. SORGH_AS321]|nr:hypothetical protein [Stenotrophomonas sp. SORGH_AS_0321]
MMRDDRAITGLAELVRQLEAGSASLPHYPQLPELQPMRDAWQQLHADSRLRIALQQTPAEGGPLNSAVLVHRMLDAMQALSPDYLRHFVAYADTLAWLEQQPQPATTVPKRAPRKRTPKAR